MPTIDRPYALRCAAECSTNAEIALDHGRIDLAIVERDRALRWLRMAERLRSPRRAR